MAVSALGHITGLAQLGPRNHHRQRSHHLPQCCAGLLVKKAFPDGWHFPSSPGISLISSTCWVSLARQERPSRAWEGTCCTVCGAALTCALHWLHIAAADPLSLTLLAQVQGCGGVRAGVVRGKDAGTGCQARGQAVAAWGVGDRTWQQEGGSQQWLKVTCWEVSELELSVLLQNKLLDWDPSCPSVLLFSLGV